MRLSSKIARVNRLMLVVGSCLAVASSAFAAQTSENEHRLSQGVTVALGIGAEVAHGDYGRSADATSVTVPVLLAVNPSESVDLTLEVPLAYQTSRSGSGVVVTQSGGMGGRMRGTGMMRTTGIASVSTAIISTGSSRVTEAGLGDISLGGGWTVVQDSANTPKIRPTFYIKAPSGDKTHGLGTGTFEGGPGLSLSKWLGDFQLFGEGAYIFQNTIASYQGKNYASYSAGVGMQATDRLFVSLYAKGTTPQIDGGTAPAEGRLKLNFLQSRRVAWEVYGSVGFTNASPAAGGGLLVMYQF